MSGKTSSEEFSSVDTSAMRLAAENIRKRLKAIDSAQQDLYGCYRQIDGIWDGAAATVCKGLFYSSLAKMISAYNSYLNIPKDLNSYADQYELADSQATYEASEVYRLIDDTFNSFDDVIEKPQWSVA